MNRLFDDKNTLPVLFVAALIYVVVISELGEFFTYGHWLFE
ncbi:hypothetical protein [Rahnella sp. ChDrAdgB13]|nr:hypothetical protein [Rahnella sp. ChDrAdgB13]